jgi:hypothetical protein
MHLVHSRHAATDALSVRRFKPYLIYHRQDRYQSTEKRVVLMIKRPLSSLCILLADILPGFIPLDIDLTCTAEPEVLKHGTGFASTAPL